MLLLIMVYKLSIAISYRAFFVKVETDLCILPNFSHLSHSAEESTSRYHLVVETSSYAKIMLIICQVYYYSSHVTIHILSFIKKKMQFPCKAIYLLSDIQTFIWMIYISEATSSVTS